MKGICDYKEFDPDGSKSLKDFTPQKPIAYKKELLSYLKNGVWDGVRCSTVYDYIAGKKTGNTMNFFTNGRSYAWTSEEIYHFEKYNIELNEDFIRHVLKRYGFLK